MKNNKKINTKDLISKIEKVTKARIASQPVVSLADFRDAAKKENPRVILVIEDDETMRLALKRIFESEGYITKLAADATALSEVLDDTPIDLILMDVGLPWVNGFELCRIIKTHTQGQKLPVLFLTGRKEKEDKPKPAGEGGEETQASIMLAGGEKSNLGEKREIKTKKTSERKM
jgi:two-component system aerobic respiration control protein ArcA